LSESIDDAINFYIKKVTDIHDDKTRSFNMSRVRSRDTAPEIIVRKFLFSKGLRFRLHCKELPGKPDIVLPMYKTIVLVNGCFWHGHKSCSNFVIPQTRKEWWVNKIMKTRERDKKTAGDLKKLGWHVHVVWECELSKKNRTNRLLDLFQKILMVNS
jgi:DNA mismatch endonuclease (patch repair protein)